MTISCFSASRRNRERSSLISDKGTSFIRAFRTALAILPPPIWARSPRPQRTRLIHHKILEPRQHEVDTAVALGLAAEGERCKNQGIHTSDLRCSLARFPGE